MYKLTLYGSVIRISDNAVIPSDPKNLDWAAYQEWLASGNTPESAETDVERSARLTSELRGQRNSKIAENVWMVDRHRQEQDLGIATTLTQLQYIELLTYIQALRDMTEMHTTLAELEAPTWPVKPGGI